MYRLYVFANALTPWVLWMHLYEFDCYRSLYVVIKEGNILYDDE